MNTDPEITTEYVERFAAPTEAPSADYIQAISEFLDTDPNDLLLELGYYRRDEASTSF